MRIAYLITAYTDSPQLARLIERLTCEEAYFFVHVDSRSDIRPFEEAVAGLKRVRFTERRIDMVWGSFRQVECQLLLMTAAMESGIGFDWLFFTSAQDFPIWSNRRIADYLAQRGGRELIMGIDMTRQKEEISRPYTVYYPLNNHRYVGGTLRSKFRVALRRTLYALGKRKRLTFEADGRTWRLHKGSDWFAFTPRLARVVMDAWANCPELRKWFRTSRIPSETFIHTVVFSSPMAESCTLATGDYTTLADLTPNTFIDYATTIKVMDEGDVDRVLRSGKMFARKVVTGKSDAFVSAIDAVRERNDDGNDATPRSPLNIYNKV